LRAKYVKLLLKTPTHQPPQRPLTPTPLNQETHNQNHLIPPKPATNPNHIASTTTHKTAYREIQKKNIKKPPRKSITEKPPLALIYSTVGARKRNGGFRYLPINHSPPHLLSKTNPPHPEPTTDKRPQNPKPAQSACPPSEFSAGKEIYGEKGERLGDEYCKGNVKERKGIEEEKGREKNE